MWTVIEETHWYGKCDEGDGNDGGVLPLSKGDTALSFHKLTSRPWAGNSKHKAEEVRCQRNPWTTHGSTNISHCP